MRTELKFGQQRLLQTSQYQIQKNVLSSSEDALGQLTDGHNIGYLLFVHFINIVQGTRTDGHTQVIHA